MAEGPVFVDTAALIALVNRDDALHGRAVRVQSELAGRATPYVTSDWVLSEFLGGAARRPLREAAIRAVERLRQSRRTTIVPATRVDWDRAFELFTSRADKDWSLVDCTSMLLCQDQAIRRVFTHDHHFSQAGFEVLLR